MKLRSPSGFTLIEILISISLLSLLSVGMLWGLRVGVNAMTKTNSRVMSNRRVTGAQRILQQQVANLMPVVAEMASPTGTSGRRIMFFQGEPQSMRFVSTYSLQEGSRGRPQILEYQVIPGDKGLGVRLIVNERPYTGSRSAGVLVVNQTLDVAVGGLVTKFVPIGAGSQSFVLADKLASCQFLFQEARPAPEIERWVPVWTSDHWPTAIRVQMQPLTPGDGQLHMSTLTSPVRINRLAFELYDDATNK